MTYRTRLPVVVSRMFVSIGCVLVFCAVAFTAEPTTRPAATQPSADVSVRFMLRGYCYAGSNVKDDRAPGGFGTSENLPKRLTGEMLAPDGKIALVADSAMRVAFAKHNGVRLLLINRTNSRTAFRASDSRLSIVQEALDADCGWKPIEYLPSSWCGNSYHRVFLDPGEYWEFAAPRYTGERKTKLRFVLLGEKEPLYSNEFDGAINPEQLTVKQGHRPTDIMDPYLD